MSDLQSLITDQFQELEFCLVLDKDPTPHTQDAIAQLNLDREIEAWLNWLQTTHLDVDLFRIQLKDKSRMIFKKIRQQQYLAIHNRRENIAMLLTFIRGLNYLQEDKRDMSTEKEPETQEEADLKMLDAQRIQQLIIPSLTDMQSSFRGVFVVHQQQDLVGGDFYWYQKVGDCILLALVDCTGHSVEGAMTSMVCNSLLNQAMSSFDPNEVSTFVKHFCHQIENYNSTTKDMFNYGIGAELGVFCFNYAVNEFRFVSTGISAFLKRNSELELLKAKKLMVHSQLDTIQEVMIPLNELEGVYGFTDGLTDQFNASDDKKLGYRGVKEMIRKEEAFNSQYYNNALNAWKGDNMQYDDITMIGIAV